MDGLSTLNLLNMCIPSSSSLLKTKHLTLKTTKQSIVACKHWFCTALPDRQVYMPESDFKAALTDCDTYFIQPPVLHIANLQFNILILANKLLCKTHESS